MKPTQLKESNGGASMASSGEGHHHGRRSVPPGFKLEPPDGGFQAWLVVAGAALAGMSMIVPSITFSFILNDILVAMDTKTSTAAWIPSIMSTVNMFCAPVCSIVISKYSCRVAVMLGSLVSVVGMILSFFAPSIEVLFLTLGVFTGVAQGLVVNANLLALSQYFRRRYSFAMGIVIAFWASSRVIFSPLIQLMLDSNFDFRGVLLIAGGISLHACVGAATFQPVERHLVLVPIKNDEDDVMLQDFNNDQNGDTECGLTDSMLAEQEKVNSDKSEACNSDTLENDNRKDVKRALKEDITEQESAKPESKVMTEPSNSYAAYKDIALPEPPKRKSGFLCRKMREFRDSICRILDFSLFVQPLFYLLLASRLIGQISSIYPVIFLPPYLITKGLEPMEAATVASILAGAEIAGRVVNPWVQSHFRLNVVYFYIFLSAMQGILLFVLVFAKSFTTIIAIIAVMGVVHGGCVAFSLVVLMDCFGPGKLSSVLALTKPIQGVVSLGVGPIIGYVRDQTGNYDRCYSFFGSLRFLVCIIWCLKPLAMRREKVTVHRGTVN